jgi:hypothetical protein
LILDAGKSIAGRGRRYHRVVIDGLPAKDGDNKTDGSMMELAGEGDQPTLYVKRPSFRLLELCWEESR